MNTTEMYENALYEYLKAKENSYDMEFLYEELTFLYTRLVRDGFSKIELISLKEKVANNFEYDKLLEELFYVN